MSRGLKMSNEEKQLEKALQTALLQAVLNGHDDAVRKGGEGLNEYFSKTRTTGPQALDYLPPEKGKVREGGNQLTDTWLLWRNRGVTSHTPQNLSSTP